MTNYPDTIKFTNGLTATRLDHVPSENGIYRVCISGFNDPVISITKEQMSENIDYHSVRFVWNGRQ